MGKTHYMELWQRQDGKCCYCGQPFNSTDFTRRACITETEDGEKMSCKSCISKKKNASFDDFRIRVACDHYGYPRMNAEIIQLLKDKGMYDTLFPEGMKFWYENRVSKSDSTNN